jgi:hypothetical protein
MTGVVREFTAQSSCELVTRAVIDPRHYHAQVASDRFHAWLEDRPTTWAAMAHARFGLGYFKTEQEADKLAIHSRMERHTFKEAGDDQRRGDAALRYKVFRKMGWFARGCPQAQ